MGSFLKKLLGGDGEIDNAALVGQVAELLGGDDAADLPDEEVRAKFDEAVAKTSPEELKQAATQVYSKLPDDFRGQLSELLTKRVADAGASVPAAATGDDAASPAQLADLTSIIQQVLPGGLGALFGGAEAGEASGGGGGGFLEKAMGLLGGEGGGLQALISGPIGKLILNAITGALAGGAAKQAQS